MNIRNIVLLVLVVILGFSCKTLKNSSTDKVVAEEPVVIANDSLE